LQVEAPMLDNPEKTKELLTALKAALPFEVEIAPAVVKRLQEDDLAIADDMRHLVSEVSYAGDEGGIICHIVPPQGRDAILFSLTYVRMPRPMALTTTVLSYQKHRLKKLKKQAR
jgi:hypothetical protein